MHLFSIVCQQYNDEIYWIIMYKVLCHCREMEEGPVLHFMEDTGNHKK